MIVSESVRRTGAATVVSKKSAAQRPESEARWIALREHGALFKTTRKAAKSVRLTLTHCQVGAGTDLSRGSWELTRQFGLRLARRASLW